MADRKQAGRPRAKRPRGRFTVRRGDATPKAVAAYWKKFGARIALAFGFAAILLGYTGFQMLTNAPFSASHWHPVQGASVLAGFAILGAAVAALHVTARSMRRAEKAAHPGPTLFVGMASMVLLTIDAGLIVIALTEAFDPSPWPNPPYTNVVYAGGVVAFGAVIAGFAADAAVHSDLLDSQKKALKDDKVLKVSRQLAALPMGRPAAKLRRVQAGVLFGAVPLGCAALGLWWFNPVVAAISAGFAALLAFYAAERVSGAVAAFHSGRRIALAGRVASDALLWALFAVMFSIVSIEWVAASRDLPATTLPRIEALLLLVTLAPAYTATWFARNGRHGRGVVLDIASRKLAQRVIRLRIGTAPWPLRKKLSNEWGARTARAARKLIGQLAKAVLAVFESRRRWISVGFLTAAGIAPIALVAWLVVP